MRKTIKVILRVLAVALACLVLVLASYVIYVFAAYYRVEDNLSLKVSNRSSVAVETGKSYTLSTWNLGFGAYSQDFSFFMDGGTESRAYSKEEVLKNMNGMMDAALSFDADFLLFQEADVKATRSYYVDEAALISEAFSGYSNVYAQNYDSPYLYYPLIRPHGKSQAGIVTLSRYKMGESVRRSLPVETGFYKFFDLDRCYSVTRFSLNNSEKELVLINLHLSAYTSDGSIATEQLQMLIAEMQTEYEKGNYVIAGGDFNKDLLGDSSLIFGVKGENATWAQPFPEELLPETISLVTSDNVPSCRNCDMGYLPGETFVLTLDGFLISDNVSVGSIEVKDYAFLHSDHNPVVMQFTLEEV